MSFCELKGGLALGDHGGAYSLIEFFYIKEEK